MTSRCQRRWSVIGSTRGPLVYSEDHLSLLGPWRERRNRSTQITGCLRTQYIQLLPAMVEVEPDALDDAVSVERSSEEEYPWMPDNAPVRLTVPGRRIPAWTEYNDSVGPLPPSPVYVGTEAKELTLVPYGITTLRLSVFPVVILITYDNPTLAASSK